MKNGSYFVLIPLAPDLLEEQMSRHNLQRRRLVELLTGHRPCVVLRENLLVLSGMNPCRSIVRAVGLHVSFIDMSHILSTCTYSKNSFLRDKWTRYHTTRDGTVSIIKNRKLVHTLAA